MTPARKKYAKYAASGALLGGGAAYATTLARQQKAAGKPSLLRRFSRAVRIKRQSLRSTLLRVKRAPSHLKSAYRTAGSAKNFAKSLHVLSHLARI